MRLMNRNTEHQVRQQLRTALLCPAPLTDLEIARIREAERQEQVRKRNLRRMFARKHDEDKFADALYMLTVEQLEELRTKLLGG